MSDSDNGPEGQSPTPPPPPEWVAPPPPWAASPPPGGEGGEPPWGPPGWTPGPWYPYGQEQSTYTTVESKPRRRIPLVLTAVIAAVMALIGVGIGSQLGGDNSPASHESAPTTVPSAPTTTPGNGSSGNGGFPTSPSGNSGSGRTITSSPQARAIAAKVQRAIVDINTQLAYQDAEAAGTGMILTSSGEVLTNNHVIDGATSIKATIVTTGRTYTAKVVGYDATNDVAVLQLEGASGLPTVSLADSFKVVPGDPVVAIGNAGGVGGLPSVVTGIVQTINQAVTVADDNGSNPEHLVGLIGTSAPIQPGDSGGPLVNSAAQVIGMDTAGSSANRFGSASSVGLAIPSNKALAVVKQIVAGKASSTVHIGLPAFLGVQLEGNQRGGLGLGGGNSSSASGALIGDVVSGSPADSAGLVPGDTITSIGGHNVSSTQSLLNLTKNYKPGQKVTIGWTDEQGANHNLQITLGSGPPG